MGPFVLVALFGCGTSSETAPAVVDAGASPAVKPAALGLNDVSVLLPIPPSPAAPGYLGPESSGAKGPLLPKDVFDEVPPFPVKPAQGLDYPRMRALAIRFDGCFKRPAGCEPQIRIVMQPVTDKGDTKDSALHLFYRLTEDELAAVVRGLRSMRALAPEVKDAPLDVHAGFSAQGSEGAYATALNELVLGHAGEQNLIRMTFFLRAPPVNEVWFFGGFDRANGAMSPIDIVGVGKTNQRVMLSTTPEGGYTFDLLPVEKKPEDTSLLLTSDGAKAATPGDLEKAMGAFARIENPLKYGPDDLPCAGCHISTAVTGYAQANLGINLASMPDAFTSTHDLAQRGEARGLTSSLRAFGWFGKRAMISQRVINESAAVVDDFEKRFAGP